MFLLVIVLYFIALGIDTFFHTAFWRVVPGLLICFILPGWYLTQLFLSTQYSRLECAALAPIVSVLSVSLTLLLLASAHFSLNVAHTRITILFLVTLLYVATTLVRLLRQVPLISWNRLSKLYEIQRQHWPLLLGISLFVSVQTINFFIYPFIPEADGYSLIHSARMTLATGIFSEISYRPLFPLLGISASALSGLDPATVYKVVIPLLLASSVVPMYALAVHLKLSASAKVVAIILPLTFPIIMQEMLYARPQSLIVEASFAVIWLLCRWALQGNLLDYCLAFALSIVLVLAHEFSYLLIFLCIISGFPLLMRAIKTNWKRCLLTLIITTIALYPYIAESHFLAAIAGIATSSIGQGNRLHFHWWFLNSYRNYDGDQVGWPGWETFLYYGYNLGLLALPLLIYVQWKRQYVPWLWPAWILAGICFSIAEILPRIGLVFLPDRIWLYLSIALCFAVLPALQGLRGRWYGAIILLTAGSLVAGWEVTNLKQGWVSQSEFEAASWINANTIPTSVFVSQPGNAPLLTVYSYRKLIVPPGFFKGDAAFSKAQLDAISQIPAPAQPVETFNIIDELSQFPETKSSLTTTALRDQITTQIYSLADERNRQLSYSGRPIKPVPIYVMYSASKFDSLYGHRSWWRLQNSYAADLQQFSNPELFKRVYAQGGVEIWQYLNAPNI